MYLYYLGKLIHDFYDRKLFLGTMLRHYNRLSQSDNPKFLWLQMSFRMIIVLFNSHKIEL